MKKRRRNLILAALLILIVAAGGYWYYRAGTKQSPVHYETATVARGLIVAKVTATGSLSALVTVQVGSQVSGRIGRLYVDFNSLVKKGQILAKIDPQLFEAALEQARANYIAAQANLSKAQVQAIDAERQYVRAKSLQEKHVLAQADLDTAQATSDAAKAQVEADAGAVEQARAELHQAQINLGYATIVSPIDGIVISRNVDVGQTVAASLQAPTLFTIAEDLRRIQVDTSVAEADIGRLNDNTKATFTVDAYPGERFTGTVRQIRNSPQVQQNVVTYDAVIDVDNSDLKLRPGMTANVTFVYATKKDVLKIPNAALRFRPPAGMGHANGASGGNAGASGGGPTATPVKPNRETDPNQRTIWVLRGGVPQPVAVRIGISDGSFSMVENDGIHEGDLVVTDMTGGGGASSFGGGGGGMRRFF
jgi:HlyD family secretion protein